MPVLLALVLAALPLCARAAESAAPKPEPPISYLRFGGGEPWVAARNVVVTLHNMLALRVYHHAMREHGGATARDRARHREEADALERELLKLLAWARKNRSIAAGEPAKDAAWHKEIVKINNADPAAVRASPDKPIEP